MANMIDSLKDKMGDMSEEAKARLQQLQTDAKNGTLDDKGKAELERLRGRMQHHDQQ